MRMSSAKKNPYKDTNEAQDGQGYEGIREGQGSVFVSDVRNTQGQHTAKTIRLVTQDRTEQSNTEVGREEHDQPVQEVSPPVGARHNQANESGYRSSVWRGYVPAIRKYGTPVSNIKRDVSGLGRISIETRGLLQEKTKASPGRGLQSVGLYCKHIYRFWAKNKRGSRMINIIERAVVFLLLAGLSILTWYVIIAIGGTYV